jgi:hypothetical protein
VYELAGNIAVFRDRYKLLQNIAPFGAGEWRLYDIDSDPVEANDLSQKMPDLVKSMRADFDRYAAKVDLVPVPDGYNPLKQLQKNRKRNQVKEATDTVPPLD